MSTSPRSVGGPRLPAGRRSAHHYADARQSEFPLMRLGLRARPGALTVEEP